QPSYRSRPALSLMTMPSAIYVRLPNWIGDVCMSLPSLHVLLDTQVPIVVCARPWAKDLLAGYKLGGFIEMKGRWREDRAAVQQHKKKAQHAHPRGLLLPDSLRSEERRAGKEGKTCCV